jgi:fumarate reductase subunit D
LSVYQAVSATAANKERTYWNLGGTCLVASVLLLILGVVLGIAVVEDAHNGYVATTALQCLTTVVAGFGVLISTYWLVLQHRLSHEVAHWQGLLRQLEGEFAGAEFYRSSFRLLIGQPVRSPRITPHFDEWYPGVTRLGWFSRALAGLATALLPTAFLVAWIALAILPWVIP